MDTHTALTPASPDAPIPQEDIESLKAELNALLGAVPPDKQWTSAEVESGLRDLRRHFAANLAPGLPLSDPDIDLSEADLLDRYLDGHQETVYVHGRFWRQPLPQAPWQPVPEHLIRAEVLMTLHNHQDRGVSPTRHRLDSVLALLKVRLGAVVEPGGWDDTTGFIPFPNIAFELGGRLDEGLTYDLLPFIATTLPYTYEPIAECPAWEAFLQSAIPDGVQFFQEFAGYCVTHYTHHALSLWLIGAPNSGLSLIFHGLKTLLGNLAELLSLDDLARGRLDPGALASKRLLLVGDVPADFGTLPGLAALIDGAPLPAPGEDRRLQPRPSHAKLVLGFEAPPLIQARHLGLYGRAAVLMAQPRPAGAYDQLLKDKLSREGQGMYNWAIRGWARLVRRGHFDLPATMLQSAQRLWQASLTPRHFVDQHCLYDPDARTQSSHLYLAYVAWCRQQGIEPMSARALAGHWADLGFERTRAKGNYFWAGVRLLNSAPIALPTNVGTPSVDQETPSPA